MRVLLTGAAGFLGSYVLQRLIDSGQEIAVLIRPDSDCWRISTPLDQVTRITADFSAIEGARRAISAFAPDTVLHLGWKGVAARDRNAPYQPENLRWTTALARFSADIGVETWLGLGSQAEYGPHRERISENTPTKPTTLYGRIKLESGINAQRICTQAGLRFAWIRVFSTYGPKDNPDWMVPSLVLQLLRGQSPALTEATQIWDFLYASDAAEAICRVAEEPKASGIFNLGSGEARSIRCVAETIRDLIDPRLRLGFGQLRYREDQIMFLQTDVSRLREVVGWRPDTSLIDGLRQTIEWFREHAS